MIPDYYNMDWLGKELDGTVANMRVVNLCQLPHHFCYIPGISSGEKQTELVRNFSEKNLSVTLPTSC